MSTDLVQLRPKLLEETYGKSHGHVGDAPRGVVMRCGGPALCKHCRGELILKLIEELSAAQQERDIAVIIAEALAKTDKPRAEAAEAIRQGARMTDHRMKID